MNLSTKLLRLLPPEPAHQVTIRAMQWGLADWGLAGRGFAAAAHDPRLAVSLWGHQFSSPLGMAAGFDKQGQVMSPLLRLGFGFVEVGTITPEPQVGNARPRVFRAPAHRAVINRYGFNSDGHAAVLQRLRVWRARHPRAALGINLGMNKGAADPMAAYIKGIQTFEDLATYLVINLSSPNTQGLRDQQTQGLPQLIAGLKSALSRPVPLLLKVAPDLSESQIHLISDAAMTSGLDGLIVSNTTLDRPAALPHGFRAQAGGLSGAPLTQKSLAVLRQFSSCLRGAVPLIGVGGLMSGADAVDRLRAGADLLQVYTGLMYQGPRLIHDIHASILQAMTDLGVSSPQDLKEK